MDKNISIVKFINEIGEMAFAKLKSLNVPPYPKYYYDAFMSLLHECNSSEIGEISKKYSYLFTLEGDNGKIIEESVRLAKKSLEQFENSSNNIKEFTGSNTVELNNLHVVKDTHPNTKALLAIFNSFQSQILDELHASSETISKLKREIEILEDESNIDSLTKAYNKRALVQDLNEILTFGTNRDLDMHIALLDADNFKHINEKFGHIAGDKTLIYITKLLQNSVRHGTKIYRYTGEKFVILLNRMKIEDAKKSIERILKEARESKLFYKGNNIGLTLSAGISSHKENDDYESLLERSKQALILAKSEGKDCLREY